MVIRLCALLERALTLRLHAQHWSSGATNEELVGKAIAKHGRDKFIIATKFGILSAADGFRTDSSAAAIRSQLQDSLTRLGTDYVDLYYQHRSDPNTSTNQDMKPLTELIVEGQKI